MPVAESRNVTLKDGSSAELCIIRAPDPGWQPRLRAYLNNPPEPRAPSLHEFLLASDLSGLTVSYNTMLVGDEIAGCIFTTDGGASGYINSTFVPREHRQKGIARLLMDALEDDFEGRGGRVRFLTTWTGSPAEDLFTKVGYRVRWERGGRTGMEKHYGGGSWDSYFDIDADDITIRDLEWRDWNGHRSLGWQAGGYHPIAGDIIGLMRDRLSGQAAARVAVTGDGRMVGCGAVRRKDAWIEGPSASVVDVHVHSGFSSYFEPLLDAVLPDDGIVQTFLEGTSTEIVPHFESRGFAFETSLRDDFNHHNPDTPDIRVYTRT